MAKYLATFSDTIDDIELNGFVVMSEKEMERYEELANSITWPFTYELGEEEIEYTSGEDLLCRIDFREISNEEGKTFKKVFNNKFGVFVEETYLENIVDEESDDDDEDDFDDDLDDYDDY